VTRKALLLVAIAVAVIVGASQLPKLHGAVNQLTLPLNHASVIQQQANAKHLDPSLIAAVIYAETRFNPRRSPAGAEGLMQILPSTAELIAKRSGGTAFVPSDLGNAEVNIRYGSWYLRYLLDHYGGNESEAVAAYNAGMGNVDQWIAKANSEGSSFSVQSIPFPETRAYVERVLAAKSDYRRTYPRELGIR
jgi:soluble lytic murein transglycosylase